MSRLKTESFCLTGEKKEEEEAKKEEEENKEDK